MIKLYARLHEAKVKGFYFKTAKEYEEKMIKAEKLLGSMIEKVEIVFMKGGLIDNELFETLKIHPGNLEGYLTVVKQSDFVDKLKFIIWGQVMGVFFKSWEEARTNIRKINIYEFDTLKDLATHMVKEDLYEESPQNLESCPDYHRLAHRLRMTYAEITILGKNYVYSYC